MATKKARAGKATRRKSSKKAEGSSPTPTSAQGSTAPRTEKKELPKRYGLSPYQ